MIDFQSWTREELGSRHTRKNRSIEEKESYRWIKSYEAANQVALAAPETRIISIADREGDIYELLEKMPSELNKAYWLVRCGQQNRLVINRENGEDSRLWEVVKNTGPIGEIEFTLPSGTTYNRDKSKRKARKERSVQQVIRTRTVHLKPTKRKGKKLTSISITVIHCEEINPPCEEDKIEWFLLTSYPIHDVKAAFDVIGWYLCRWQIELLAHFPLPWFYVIFRCNLATRLMQQGATYARHYDSIRYS